MLGPLITLLLQGADRQALEAHLRTELDEHFGLQAQRVPTEVVDRILAWWSSAK